MPLNEPTVRFKIKSLGITEKEYAGLPFGRKIDYIRKINEFKNTAKTNHVSQKRKKSSTALKEFLKLYNVDEYYCSFYDTNQCRDDSYQIWYTVKAVKEQFTHDVCSRCQTPSVPAESVPDQSLRNCPACGVSWFEDLSSPPLK